MPVNKATVGNNEEKYYTSLLNRKTIFWDKLPYNPENTYAIHIISKKYGRVNQANVSCKADVYLANGYVSEDYLLENDFYLSENDVSRFNLTPIPNSGISVKLDGSYYTILKISPNTFKKLFDDNILATGASIYSTKSINLNGEILKGWGVSEDDFIDYFSKLFAEDLVSISDKYILGKIKTYCNEQIQKIILGSKELSDFVFKGIGNFEEPFTAHWIIENNSIKPNYPIPFIITTGSGRSKGSYTIVLKPH